MTSLLLLIVLQFAQAQTAIPIRFRAEDGVWTLPCTIAGTSGECILDTGSNICWIADRSEFQNFKDLGMVSGRFMLSRVTNPLVLVPSFTIGDMLKQNAVPVLRSNGFVGLPKYLGVISAQPFSQQGWVFDFGKILDTTQTSIIYADENVVASLKGLPQGRRIPSGNLVVEVVINGLHVNALWDSQFVTTSFSKTFVNSHPEMFAKQSGQIVLVGDFGGGQGETTSYKFSGQILAAGQNLQARRVQVVDDELLRRYGDLDLILGRDLIEPSSWYFAPNGQTYSILRHM